LARHDLRQTKCKFKVEGLLTRTESDGFYSDGITSGGNNYNKMSLSVRPNNETTIHGLELFGSTTEDVYYGYTNSDGKYEPVAIPWKDRYNDAVLKATFGEKKASINKGKLVSLEKDENGKAVFKNLTTFDAVELIKNLKDNGTISDGTPVTITGDIVYDPYLDKNAKERTMVDKWTLSVNNVYSHNPIDLEKLTRQEREANATFDMEIIVKEFYEINNETYMKGIVVGYKAIGELEFKFTSEKYANLFKTLKPYTFIHVYGKIVQESEQEMVNLEPDPWKGDSEIDYAPKQKGKSKRVFIIGQADGTSIDETLYTEEAIENAKKAIIAYNNDYQRGQDFSVNKNKDDFNNAEWNAAFPEINDEMFD